MHIVNKEPCIKKVNRVNIKSMLTAVSHCRNISKFWKVPHFAFTKMKITIKIPTVTSSAMIFPDPILKSFLSTWKGTIGCPKTSLFLSQGRQDSKFCLFLLDSESKDSIKTEDQTKCSCHGKANHLCNPTQHLISNGHDGDIIINWARKLIIHPCSHSCPSPSWIKVNVADNWRRKKKDRCINSKERAMSKDTLSAHYLVICNKPAGSSIRHHSW